MLFIHLIHNLMGSKSSLGLKRTIKTHQTNFKVSEFSKFSTLSTCQPFDTFPSTGRHTSRDFPSTVRPKGRPFDENFEKLKNFGGSKMWDNFNLAQPHTPTLKTNIVLGVVRSLKAKKITLVKVRRAKSGECTHNKTFSNRKIEIRKPPRRRLP